MTEILIYIFLTWALFFLTFCKKLFYLGQLKELDDNELLLSVKKIELIGDTIIFCILFFWAMRLIRGEL